MRRMLAIVLALSTLGLFLSLARSSPPPTIDARDLNQMKIFAYRDWQSTGVTVNPVDVVNIRARGRWLYTPNEWHGPAGHPRFRAPQFYPLPGVPGGALIGKICDNGKPFYVGANISIRTQVSGQLYLRIDDDILSDNEGEVEVDVWVGK